MFILYAQFDDTHVHKYKFPYYGDGSDIYGSIHEISYPKVREINWNYLIFKKFVNN